MIRQLTAIRTLVEVGIMGTLRRNSYRRNNLGGSGIATRAATRYGFITQFVTRARRSSWPRLMRLGDAVVCLALVRDLDLLAGQKTGDETPAARKHPASMKLRVWMSSRNILGR